MTLDISQQILSEITVHMKYARYLPNEQRRETWNELITRNRDMHIANFPHIKSPIEKAYELVYDKNINYRSKTNDKSFKLFSEVNIPYHHKELDFIDFNYQPLLYHKLSQFGPGISVEDINGDGLDDFYISGSRNYSGTFFIQERIHSNNWVFSTVFQSLIIQTILLYFTSLIHCLHCT